MVNRQPVGHQRTASNSNGVARRQSLRSMPPSSPRASSPGKAGASPLPNRTSRLAPAPLSPTKRVPPAVASVRKTVTAARRSSMHESSLRNSSVDLSRKDEPSASGTNSAARTITLKPIPSPPLPMQSSTQQPSPILSTTPEFLTTSPPSPTIPKPPIPPPPEPVSTNSSCASSSNNWTG